MKRNRRKTARRRAQELIDPFDQAVAGWHNLATLAELMQKCSHAEWVEGATVSHWGRMLLEEIQKQAVHLQALKP